MSFIDHPLNKYQERERERKIMTPMETNFSHDESIKSTEANVTRCRKLVGSLMYIANNSRPDIAFSVNKILQTMSKAYAPFLKAAMRIVLYLKTTRERVITLPWNNKREMKIKLFSDSDFGQCKTTRNSTSGGLTLVNSAPIN